MTTRRKKNKCKTLSIKIIRSTYSSRGWNRSYIGIIHDGDGDKLIRLIALGISELKCHSKGLRPTEVNALKIK
jgi:hypothetical protein